MPRSSKTYLASGSGSLSLMRVLVPTYHWSNCINILGVTTTSIGITRSVQCSRRLNGQTHRMHHMLAVTAIEPDIPHMLDLSGLIKSHSSLLLF